jgi:hypothetical protein
MSRMLCLALMILFPALAADISGTWDMTVNSEAGTANPVFTFQQQGETLTGNYKGLLGEAKVSGTIKGDKVEFSFDGEYEGNKFKVVYSGTVESAGLMKGTARFGDLGEASWSGKKR